MISERYILKGHEPVLCDDLLDWGRWFENTDNRRVCRDVITVGVDHEFVHKAKRTECKCLLTHHCDVCNKPERDTLHTGEVMVSTIFIGLNHNWGKGAPLLFETMVFGSPLSGEMERYSTWAQAEAGHARLLKRVKSALKLPQTK